MVKSDIDSDLSDDDLLLSQPIFQVTSKSEKKKNEKMHKYLDSYLEKEEKRFAQKELIRDMQKDVSTENSTKLSEKDSHNNSLNTFDMNSCADKKSANRSQSKKRKEKSIDAVDEEYRRIMEENGKLNRDIRKRRLRNAAEGIDFDYQGDENHVNENQMLSHVQHSEIFENEKDSERNKEIFAAKVTGYSSKVGSRQVLHNRQHGPVQDQTDEVRLQQNYRISYEAKNKDTKELSNFLTFYESEEAANEALKRIISNFSKKNKSKLAKSVFNVFLLPIERAIKKKVISFFLQHGTLKKVFQNACDLLFQFAKNDIIASKTGKYPERYVGQIKNIFILLSDIVCWLWHVCISSGCSNSRLSLSLRQGAYFSLSSLMQTDFLTTSETSSATKMLQNLYTTTVFSSFSFQNFLKGFQLACGYKCPIIIDEDVSHQKPHSKKSCDASNVKKSRNSNDIGSTNEGIDYVLVRQYLEIWGVAFKCGHIYWKKKEYTKDSRNKRGQIDSSDKTNSLSRLATACLEVLLFSSLDYCFYSGNLLLESLENLIQFAIHYIYNQFRAIDLDFKLSAGGSPLEEDDSNELFFTWMKNTAHQIISKCQYLTTGTPRSNDEDDLKGWLALALLVWNVPIFRNDTKIDSLSIIFKAIMAEYALHLSLFDQMLYPTLPTIDNIEKEKRLKTEASWVALLKRSKPTQHTLKSSPYKSCNKSDPISHSTWQFFLASKCITLAEIGINRKQSQNIQKEGPRFYAVTLIAHVCAEIGNSLFVFPNQDDSQPLIQNISFLMRWDDSLLKEENKYQLQIRNGKLPSLHISDQNEFVSIYHDHLKVMHDRLKSLEEQCLKIKKDITMVFTNPHLRRVKEFLVWLATTYRQWRLESAKIIGEEERNHKLVPVQSNLKEWLHGKNEN